MKNAKLKQFAVSLLAVLSLFVSSVSACVCSHHQEKTKTDSSSCHEHSAKTKAENHHGSNLLETIQTAITETECCCIQPAPKVFAKSQTVKFEKQAVIISLATPIEIDIAAQTASIEIDFTKPLYLSDSFYNLSPGRAPPRL